MISTENAQNSHWTLFEIHLVLQDLAAVAIVHVPDFTTWGPHGSRGLLPCVGKEEPIACQYWVINYFTIVSVDGLC